MPVPANRAKIQLARGIAANLIAAPASFEEGELAYATDENLLYIKEGAVLERLEYVTTTDLQQAVSTAIGLTITAQNGITATPQVNSQTDLTLDEPYVRDLVGITDSSGPSGFADKTETVIAYRTAEQQIWLYPVGTSADVWCRGIKHTFTSFKYVPQPTTTGIYYIYLDNTFTLQIKSSAFNYKLETPVCVLFWDQTNGVPLMLNDHRHGIAMDWSTLEFIKDSRSATVAGFDIGNITTTNDGTADSQAKFSVNNGSGRFIDIEIPATHSATPSPNTAQNLFEQELSPAAKIPIFYQVTNNSVAEWRHSTPTEYAWLEASGVPAYNSNVSTWSNTALSTGDYFITFVCATKNTLYPVIGIAGQGAYDSINSAAIVRLTDLDLGEFVDIELKEIYKIIYKYDTSYTNTKQVVIAAYEDLRRYDQKIHQSDDFVDHGRLKGLGNDDHLQYVHISNARTITASHVFDGQLIVQNSTASVDSASGAITVSGGMGVAGDFHLDGDLDAVINGGNF